MQEPHPQSMECPACGGREAITVDRNRRCDRRDCNEIAVWDYYNKISGTDKELCQQHLEDLRPDVSASEWVDHGYAERIKPRMTA